MNDLTEADIDDLYIIDKKKRERAYNAQKAFVELMKVECSLEELEALVAHQDGLKQQSRRVVKSLPPETKRKRSKKNKLPTFKGIAP